MPGDCAVNLDKVQRVSKNRIGPLIVTPRPGKVKEFRARKKGDECQKEV
jgi:hypothetical protein